MSVKHALLALLADGPQGAYRLRSRFEESTGGAWPLNIGQAYSTLQRLERDKLIQSAGMEPSQETGKPDIELYELTLAGSEELEQWWLTPIDRGKPDRDEFTIKLALAIHHSPTTAQAVLDRQRTALLKVIQELGKERRSTPPDGVSELGWRMYLDRQMFLTEAELRWLEHVQTGVLARELHQRSSEVVE
ncbi:MAG: helix-turn-helix transcriptional regulator [Actinomycetaceae bacterium]|nr:helix-turn-helix transcriptional regulator [Actinomycetaceae bacterium]